MFFNSRKNKEEHRYYLLPGMGRSNKRHRTLIFRWSLVFGLVISALLGVALYYLQTLQNKL